MGSAALGDAIKTIREWAMTEGRQTKTAGSGERRVRLARVQRSGAAGPAAQGRVPLAAQHDHARRAARCVHGRRRRQRAEGLGHRTGGVALHALVPADDRHHRREARLVLRAGPKRRRRGGIQRQGTGQGRARCVELPVGRHAQHVRSARLHGVGPDQPAVAAAERQQRDARDPDGVCQLDRRSARQEDAAAALDGSAVDAGGRGCSSCSARARRGSPRRAVPSRSIS